MNVCDVMCVVIGKGGEQISSIQSQSGARVQFAPGKLYLLPSRTHDPDLVLRSVLVHLLRVVCRQRWSCLQTLFTDGNTRGHHVSYLLCYYANAIDHFSLMLVNNCCSVDSSDGSNYSEILFLA